MDKKPTEEIIDSMDWSDGTVVSMKQTVEQTHRSYRRWVRYHCRARNHSAGSIPKRAIIT